MATQLQEGKYSALSMDCAITGLYTHRNPLRDGDVPYMYRKVYGAARLDSLWDGINREITARLTNARRPGTSVFNTNTFPAAYSFFPYKYIQDGVEVVRLLLDGVDGKIYDFTGGTKSVLFTKSAGAGPAYFLAAGTELFFTDGVENKKWVRSSRSWAGGKSFTSGFIVDQNNNLQLAIGGQTATITYVQITSNVCTLFFDPTTPIDIPLGTKLTLAGTTTVAALSGTTQTITAVPNEFQVQFAFTHADVAYGAETGTASTGSGVSGSSAPTWGTAVGAVTVDGGMQWECRGSSIQDWMFAAAAQAPTVTQVTAPSIYPAWAASTWYGPAIVIVDGGGNVQLLTQGGTTGSSEPVWATSAGAVTTDGTAAWTCRGGSGWQASHAYSLGDVVVNTFTYYITTTRSFPYPPYYEQTQTPVTVTQAYRCSTAGTSGASAPAWSNGTSTQVIDNTAAWTNIGTPLAWSGIGATQATSVATQILDSNGNLQQAQVLGKTGATVPTTWGTDQGANTVDGAQTWQNVGPYSPANTGAWIWAYSGYNAITGDISTASKSSSPIIVGAGQQPVVQGFGFSDPQVDTIILWRTAQGKATLIESGRTPNPGGGKTWVFTDTSSDQQLIPESVAPVSNSNDPPKVGMAAPVYHGGRVWGIYQNTIVYSGGPDIINGSGYTGFAPLNFDPLGEQPIRLCSGTTSKGQTLFIFGTTNIYAIFGDGTASNPFTPPVLYMPGVGLKSYHALDVIGSTFYLMTAKRKVVSLDPSGGYQEIGFAIGDQFKQVTTGGSDGAQGVLYDPASTFITWHEQDSDDTGIYVSDGTVGWFRYSPCTSPETGYVWSPRAVILAGTSAVQSIETSPGITQLLIGPPLAGGPILYRDTTVFTDWKGNAATPFPSWDIKGNIPLCDSGEIAEIAFIALASTATGTRPKVGILLNEIKATQDAPFDWLEITSTDPPGYPPAESLYSDRYAAMQNGICPKCTTFQLQIDYGVQNAADELLQFAVIGARYPEIIQ